jgi:putative phosphoribosyl transferase
MYFKSRVAAGQTLAKQIAKKYTGQDCAVVAMNDGGVMIGSQIALKLHCVLTMLLSEAINLPRENSAVGGISQDGSFSYNQLYSKGEIEEFVSEYYNFIEQEKMTKVQEMHRMQGKAQLIHRSLITNRNVILVTDGLLDGFALDVALQYLKPIHTKKIIVATPLASVSAVDRMHILADDIFCLNVLEDYMNTDHYYDKNDVPSHDRIVRTVAEIVAHWK